MLNWVTYPGRFDSLAQISQHVERAARQAGLDERAVYALQLAVDEACSNIIEHAYGGENLGDIECACVSTGDGLQIYLHDHGRPFQPDKVRGFNPHTPLNRCKTGGAGLFLMRQMMDEVRFEFHPEEGNTCVLVKRNC